MQWTPDQQKVIDKRDDNILVSASAGSGKTAVLVARILAYIMDPKEPVDIDRLLIVTFTKAAAGEMRERIGKAITDALAEGLLRTVMKNAAVLHRDPQNYQARAEVMWCSSLSHNGLTGCGNDGNDFASHRLEHELGALYDVTHGAGLTAVWPSWARYVYRNCLPRFVQFAVNVMGVVPAATDEETALLGIAAMENYFRSIGMPVTLSELLGRTVSEEEIQTLAHNCALATGGKVGSAMVLYEADIANIYRMANK